MIVYRTTVMKGDKVIAQFHSHDLTEANNKAQTVYDSGIRLNILTDYFELYFPFYSSLGNELKHSNYSEKIRFKILTT